MGHGTYEHIAVSESGIVATIEVRRGPNNFIDTDMVAEIADALDVYDRMPGARAIVLCAEGKHFCAGADFGSRGADGVARTAKRGRHLYKEAQRLWKSGKPIVAVVHGAAIGAGLGLAVMADFRVTCPEARFSANFTRLGYHPGFGLTATLPRLIGAQKAAMMMYTGRRLTGEEALAIGLADYCVPLDQVRAKAVEVATEIAQSGRWRSSRRARRCAEGWPRRWRARPNGNSRSRTGCATPPISRKAPKPWASGDCPTFGRPEKGRRSDMANAGMV